MKKIFRYGIAFSLQPTRTVPDISIFMPKIERFNEYLKQNPHVFSEMFFWYYQEGWSKPRKVKCIDADLARMDTFIFIGKYISKEEEPNRLTSDELTDVLTTFDNLLELYIYVES